MKSYKLIDQMGDSVTVSLGQPSARVRQITLQVTETFMGKSHQAAVHVDPVELVQAIIALGWEGAPAEVLPRLEIESGDVSTYSN